MSALPPTIPPRMKAVVLHAPFQVSVEERPSPRIESESDVILKVLLSGLCGSDLHMYRGHSGAPFGFILGHEVVGQIVDKGKAVKTFDIGDHVVAAFHPSCNQCYHCQRGLFARCVQSVCFGTPHIDGAQAEYFRVPFADTTLLHLPRSAQVPEDLYLLMADVLPTGTAVASLARKQLSSEGVADDDGVCVVLGCGPVGLCAITAAKTMFGKVFATDPIASRLKTGERHGAIALPYDELQLAISQATNGRGADAVLEVVGHPVALKQACELARSFGVVSSCGVHTRDVILDAGLLYSKNLRLCFGRCSVRSYAAAAFELLVDNAELFGSFIEQKAKLDDAPDYYTRFERNEIGKTAFIL